MKKELSFLWIDDEPSRTDFADSLGRHSKYGYKAKIDFVSLKNKNVVDELGLIRKLKQPDLIIIDHVFNKIAKENVIREGSTTAELIKEGWPSCPIVCVTGVRKKLHITLNKRASYEDIFIDDDLLNHYDSLFILAHDFRLLLKNNNRNTIQLMDLLKPPIDDKGRLESCMPQEIKFMDDGQPIRFFKWVHDEIFNRPGFLYSKLWAATFVGVKEDSFTKVERALGEARYSGVFADYDGPRWWGTKIKEIIYKRISSPRPIPTWELGRDLPKLTRRDYSMCCVCKKNNPPPETVGYVDVESNEAKPMHLRCSVAHPRYQKRLYFDEIRMIKPAE
ncbi:MAG: response regulator [Candidatus Omnitrophota bacterium]